MTTDASNTTATCSTTSTADSKCEPVIAEAGHCEQDDIRRQSVDDASECLWRLKQTRRRPIAELQSIFDELWQSTNPRLLHINRFRIAANDTALYYSRFAWKTLAPRLAAIAPQYGCAEWSAWD